MAVPFPTGIGRMEPLHRQKKIKSGLRYGLPEKTKRKVVVIGGGPAGMQAAITANENGHNVTLFEKSGKLGGQLNIACVPPHKSPIKWAVEWMAGELERQNVDVRLNCDADAEMVAAMNLLQQEQFHLHLQFQELKMVFSVGIFYKTILLLQKIKQ